MPRLERSLAMNKCVVITRWAALGKMKLDCTVRISLELLKLKYLLMWRKRSQIPLQVGEAALKSCRPQTSSPHNCFYKKSAKEAHKMKMKMSRRQLERMMDSNTSESLKTLIRKVAELQNSRKFEHLIPNRVVKVSEGSRLGTAKPVPVQLVKKDPPVVKAVVVAEELSPGKECAKTNGTNHELVGERSLELLSTWNFVIRKFLNPLRGRAKKMWEGNGMSTLKHIDGLPLNETILKSTLFPFRVGFGKSSNVDVMRPIQNWSPPTPRLFHSSALGVNKLSNGRFFSTNSQLMNAGGKDCKKKGGGLPCLKPVMTKDKDSGNSNKLCEKLCMPCCPPARDPPLCVVAHKRKECQKMRPPRPAYSECKKAKTKPIKPCECTIERLPPCGINGDSKASGKNC